ncbi:1-deoxy-D-xylulose-5-phosphate synthase [Halioxenophilus sp. WMMB6]|uniref:1-deoxy-D-xylulose-5-phosphate synthase n=1 Tax=Halioxenophilus sp. WMMB6 TaxID=3073815 RepID=UPI00295E6203|nr:1-deoxy-D-xylulose-5-phosphate synthase [Halioxenophilus sp. WMMB6]
MLTEIPLHRPVTPLLDSINSPDDLRALEESQLPTLAAELREFLLYSVGKTGGHFGAGLGVVELTIALHYVYQTPEDRLVWDVGHQTYPHKILTERRERMHSIRQLDGLAGFPKRSESPYDTFGVGHSSTSLSAALGMAVGSQQQGDDRRMVAVIGDGAMTAGMAFEALNHIAHLGSDLLVVLNDNNMSISRNVGGLANYFSKIWASKLYTEFREGSKKVLSKIPQAWELARKTEEHVKGMVSPGTLFEELGFYYIGPIDGHDLPRLVHDISNLRELKGPKLLHVITKKGKGFAPAEDDPVGYHALNKIEPKAPAAAVASHVPDKPKKLKYQDVFGQWLCREAEHNAKLMAITPAMCEGSGMVEFAERFPDQFHDVAIAEQHAVTFAAGLACEGLKPVVAIYSTFLQRAYDQLVHDVALQSLDVTFAIDRAGLVGEDGPTHAGSFDLSYLRCIPNMVIAAPSDEFECQQLLQASFEHPGPAAVRYPRGTGTGADLSQQAPLPAIGRGRQCRAGTGVAILNFGTLLERALTVAESLNATVCDMRWVKPLDEALILAMASQHDLLVTLEDNALAGGAGSAVLELCQQHGILVHVLQLGLPDRFQDHGKREQLLEQAGLSVNAMHDAIQARLEKILQLPQSRLLP